MKILAVMRSPRKSGNTARLLNLVRESVPKEDEVEIVSLVDYDIRGGASGVHAARQTRSISPVFSTMMRICF